MTGLSESKIAADGERVRHRREELSMTQKQLADMAGTTQQHLSFLERGAVEPRTDLKVRLAQALSVPVAELFPYPEPVKS